MKFDKTIIIRYLTGNASKEEKDQLFTWLEENHQHKKLFLEYKEIWLEAPDADNLTSDALFDPENAFQTFQSRISSNKGNTGVTKQLKKRNNGLKYAANIIILLVVGALAYFYGSYQNQVNITESFNEVVVPHGGISSLLLPDNSVVWLHSGSTLKYKSNFGQAERSVYLEGEAYFDVKSNTHAPFMVNTSHMTIKVTGTAFNVKAYSDDNIVETTLEEGTINITEIKGKAMVQPIVLKPKEKFTLIKSNNKTSLENTGTTDIEASAKKDNMVKREIIKKEAYIVPNVNVEETTGWKEGVYILNNKPLPELAKILERRYNVTIEFEDESVKQNSYSGVLKDLTLEQVLEALQVTSEINYQIDKRTITLSNNKN